MSTLGTRCHLLQRGPATTAKLQCWLTSSRRGVCSHRQPRSLDPCDNQLTISELWKISSFPSSLSRSCLPTRGILKCCTPILTLNYWAAYTPSPTYLWSGFGIWVNNRLKAKTARENSLHHCSWWRLHWLTEVQGWWCSHPKQRGLLACFRRLSLYKHSAVTCPYPLTHPSLHSHFSSNIKSPWSLSLIKTPGLLVNQHILFVFSAQRVHCFLITDFPAAEIWCKDYPTVGGKWLIWYVIHFTLLHLQYARYPGL